MKKYNISQPISNESKQLCQKGTNENETTIQDAKFKKTFVLEERIAQKFEDTMNFPTRIQSLEFIVGICGHSKDLTLFLAPRLKIHDIDQLESDSLPFVIPCQLIFIQWIEKLKKELPYEAKYQKEFVTRFYEEIRRLTADKNRRLKFLVAVKIFLKSMKAWLRKKENMPVSKKNAFKKIKRLHAGLRTSET